MFPALLLSFKWFFYDRVIPKKKPQGLTTPWGIPDLDNQAQ